MKVIHGNPLKMLQKFQQRFVLAVLVSTQVIPSSSLGDGDTKCGS